MSKAVAASRHSARETGRFASQATLRAQQRALLAPSSRWRKEWVKPSSTTPGGQSSYKVLKWVKFDEGGDMAEESEQPTEEQVTAAITGAQTLLQPAETTTEMMSLEGSPAPAQTEPPANAQTASTVGPSSHTTQHIGDARSEQEKRPEDQIPPTGHSNITSNFDAKASAAADGGGETNATDPSLIPGREDDGGDMQMETEQREHDVRMAPALVGKEGEEARAALGISDPIQCGPPEITG